MYKIPELLAPAGGMEQLNAVVTGLYRKYLDIYAAHGKYNIDPADLRDLNQIFNR